MTFARVRRILGLFLPFSLAGCTAVGGLVQTGMALFQLALGLAAALLPFAAWYYYHHHQD